MIEVNTVYNENCENTMARMPDNFLDLTVTSPPYDDIRHYNGYTFDWRSVIKQLYRVTKEGGVVVWVVNDATVEGSETLTSFEQALFAKKECGFRVHDTMIYHKNGFSKPDARRYYSSFEYMFIWSKGLPKTINLIKDRKSRSAGKIIRGNDRDDGGGKQRIKSGALKQKRLEPVGVRPNLWSDSMYMSGDLESVLTYNVGWMHSYSEEWLKGHPAIFPETLVADHIVTWSNVGDLVYDPFMGSGTTGKVAIKYDRQYIGSEISAEYMKLIQRRISEQEMQLKLF